MAAVGTSGLALVTTPATTSTGDTAPVMLPDQLKLSSAPRCVNLARGRHTGGNVAAVEDWKNAGAWCLACR